MSNISENAEESIQLVAVCNNCNISDILDMLTTMKNKHGDIAVSICGTKKRFYAYKQGGILMLDNKQLTVEE